MADGSQGLDPFQMRRYPRKLVPRAIRSTTRENVKKNGGGRTPDTHGKMLKKDRNPLENYLSDASAATVGDNSTYDGGSPSATGVVRKAEKEKH